jgi:Polyketide cyclase / dehydrase and lipid transport
VRYTFLIMLVLACLTADVRAAQIHAFNVTHKGGIYRANADIYIAAPLPQVYQVLTDYNHLTRIGGAIRQSRVLKQIGPHTYLVFVKSRACVLFFCHNIQETQRVVELTSREVEAQALPNQSNVKMSYSMWRLDPDGTGTHMYWEIAFAPDFWIPPLIGPFFMKGEMRAQGKYMAQGVEKLARERAHLPPLTAVIRHAPPS